MTRSHGWGRWRRQFGPVVCILALTCLALVGSALGAHGTMVISTVAGDGSGSFGGDGGPATLAQLKDPESVSALPDGGFLIADKTNDRIRRVAPDGTITTVAGTGNPGYNGENLAATSADLNNPQGVAALSGGGFLIADTGNNRIRHVSSIGTITTVAGTGIADYDGDNGLAILADLSAPRAAVPTRDGGFLIADTGNHVVRYVSPLGTISTVAGNGDDGDDGDGGPATDARLGAPDDVAPTVDGGFLIADHDEDVVRKVSPSGNISTVAGDSSGSGSGELDEPADVEPLVGGGFLVADHGTARVFEVRPDGAIATFAGTGSSDFSGDGGPARTAELSGPHGLSITPGGDVLIADGHNHRVRMVDADLVAGVPGVDPHTGQGNNGSSDGALRPASEPVRGRSVVVAPGLGRVKVKLPGRNRWVLLDEDSSVPVGSLINARNGTVLLTSAVAGGDGSQTGTFWAGVFQVRQSREGNGMTNLVLRGANFRRCGSGRRSAPRALSSRKRRRPSRRLWAKDDNGRFRTHGRDSVATTRGTLWLTVDSCKGTLTRVREGQVRVRHRHGRRSVLVSAGERHLARRR